MIKYNMDANVVFIYFTFKIFYLLSLEREGKERERERERKTAICYSTYLCIHWLIFVCALPG